MNDTATELGSDESGLYATESVTRFQRRSGLAHALALAALSETDVRSFFRFALDRIRAELEIDLVEVALSSKDFRSLSRIESEGFADQSLHDVSLEAELAERVAAGHIITLGAETHGERTFAAQSEGAISGAWVPLTGGNETYGVLGAYSKDDRALSEDTLSALADVAEVFARAIERRRREDRGVQDIESRALRKNEEAICRAQRLASLGRFAAGIAHELTNPLTSILLGAESGLRTEDPTRARQVLGAILKNAERCSRIMDSVLKFAREEESTRWITDVNRLLERVACLAQNEAPAHRLKVKLELEARLTPVFANPTELEQAFINILRNAVEAKNGRICRVAIRSENVAKRIRISISDDGPGIPAEHLAEVFDPFFSTQRRTGGTGLGLSITQRILAAHDGSIHALNQPRGGACFVIELPAARQ
jgi:signal transduction histidine kinase